jgi:hypothetical protein
MKKLYGKGIMPFKNEMSSRDNPIIKSNEMLFMDNIISIKTRLILFVIVSISVLTGIIINQIIKMNLFYLKYLLVTKQRFSFSFFYPF